MISVIIPTYNSAVYIAETLESVCAQTYRNIEILVIDDCSSDDTSEIVAKYAYKDARIRLISLEENKGAANARNIGTKSAVGEWVAFLDSDDLWTPNKLEKQLHLINELMEMDKNRIVSFVFTGSSFVDGYGKKLTSTLHVPMQVDYERLLKQNIISCSSVLVKRSLMLRYPMPCINDIHEDFATWLQMLKAENIVAYGIDEPLLIYRITRSSRSGNKWKAALMTFRTYRFIGLGVCASIKSWLFYALRSIRKYKKINL